MFRHFVHRLTIATLFLCLALAGCADDESQAQLAALRDAVATANAETASLSAAGEVLQTRLAATQIAARTAGARLRELNARFEQLAAREAALSHANAQGAQRLRAAESAMDHFKGGLAAASQELAASEARNTTLSRQLAAVSGWLGQHDALSQSQDNTLKKMQADLQRSGELIATRNQQLSMQKHALRLASADVDHLHAKNVQLASRLKALQTKFDELSARTSARIDKLQSASDSVQSERENVQLLDASNQQLKSRLESLRKDLASANDNALRYQVAKDYLVDKVQAQEREINALKSAASEARTQHKATVATLLSQQAELKVTVNNQRNDLQQAHARNEVLQAYGDNMRAQLEQSRLGLEASEERARSAKQAKDYLDGKLSATVKELEDARAEHRMALLKVEQALQLSLEESRLLQQRAREAREQLALAQQTNSEKVAELRAQLAAAGQRTDGLMLRSEMYASTLAHLNKRNTQQSAQMRALRDELTAKINAAEAELATAKSSAQTCDAARTQASATLRELQSDNKTLRQEIEALEDRLRVLEAAQTQCKLLKTRF